MGYIFKGSLCGSLCADCMEPLGGMEVMLYLPWKEESVLTHVVASLKETFHVVTKEEAAARKGKLIATTTTDKSGKFEFALDEKQRDTAFDIDFICPTVPNLPLKAPRKAPIQIHLTTLYPQWRMNERQDYYYQWDCCIDPRLWCDIRGRYFDAWAICGYLRNCDTGSPIAKASVTAWDADFITDDNLGTATTDDWGHFRIDYTSIQFKQTFLSPWINVETDPGSFFAFNTGPDVYFKAVLGGVTLIDEKKADCRKNVGYCLCVDLCSKIPVHVPTETFPSAWTGIGQAFDISTGVSSRDFDADGYAGSGKNVLWTVIRLTGQAACRSASGNPIEYRFLVSGVTTPNGGAPPAYGNFTKIVGVTPNLFSPSLVSKLYQIGFPYMVIPVNSAQSDFDVDGWFDINKSIERALITYGFTAGDLPQFMIIDEDTLISMDTRILTTGQYIPVPAIDAGTLFPAGSKIPIEKIAIRFEIREKNGTTNPPLPGSGRTLNSAIVNNNPIFMKLSIAEMASALCTPVGGTLHAKYTIYHPHLSSANLHLRNNSSSVNRDITDAPFLTLSGNTNPVVDGHANMSLQFNNPPNDMIKCTYALRFTAYSRLHNGDNIPGVEGPPDQLFFYNG